MFHRSKHTCPTLSHANKFVGYLYPNGESQKRCVDLKRDVYIKVGGVYLDDRVLVAVVQQFLIWLSSSFFGNSPNAISNIHNGISIIFFVFDVI